ncbi:MAG: ATP-dependent nuclease [bacterium]
MILKGLKVYNYRSINNDGISLDNLGKVNILIGKNNTGKSNILRFIAEIQQLFDPNYLSNTNIFRDNFAYHNYNSEKPFSFKIKLDENIYEQILKEASSVRMTHIVEKRQSIWCEYGRKHNSNNISLIDIDYSFEPTNAVNKTININSRQKLSGIIDIVSLRTLQSFNTFLIENFRKINSNPASVKKYSVEEKSTFFNGQFFVKKLKSLKQPESHNYHLIDKYKKFEVFLQKVLNNPELEIIISANDNIQIKLGKNSNTLRNIESVGTGIHQMLILALAAVLEENSIFCIEEPEIFLHPEIQRKFIRFLINETNNQYFITTHSNAFINEEGLNIFRVWHNGNSTKVEKAIDSNSKNQILDDLGYKASDILQTNYIIWVEGPSDRIYINHWLEIADNSLIEGIHYTIMFYGGRLLSHLSASDEEIDDFININKINRNKAIFIDSDKRSEEDSINDTKARVTKEFGSNHFNLVTEGREIENYLSKEELNTALKNINKEEINNYNIYSDIFKSQSINKMKLAKEVIKNQKAIPKIGNLAEHITELVGKIVNANR